MKHPLNLACALVVGSLLAGSLLGVGCASTPTPPASPEATAATQAETRASETDAAACSTYASAVCGHVGPESVTCEHFVYATALMPAAACQAGLRDMPSTLAKVAELGKVCDELVAKLCADLGPETETCGMVRRQSKDFPPDRCAQLLAEYPQVIADLRQMEERNKPLDATAQARLIDGAVSTLGPKDAPVTIVEFSDFQCPYCAGVGPVVARVKETYPARVRVIFRHFPLPFHRMAPLAHRAALAAGEQGSFWPYHDLVFANQDNLERSRLEAHAMQLGLDMDRFVAALDDAKREQTIDSDVMLGKSVGVSGTPTMFINGRRVSNAGDYEVVAAMIEAELEATPSAP